MRKYCRCVTFKSALAKTFHGHVLDLLQSTSKPSLIYYTHASVFKHQLLRAISLYIIYLLLLILLKRKFIQNAGTFNNNHICANATSSADELEHLIFPE
jgi:hypothetical protein